MLFNIVAITLQGPNSQMENFGNMEFFGVHKSLYTHFDYVRGSNDFN